MKSWALIAALALSAALVSALPVPEDDKLSSAEEPSVYLEDVDSQEVKNNAVRSIAENDAKSIDDMNPSERITKALENVSKTLRMGIQNLGNSAIQILEGTGIATEQALGTGARIITGAAETAAEAAETGARSAIRIANGVANSLSQGTKALVDTKTQLLKGLTGSSALQADASSNSESVQRNERNSGYSSGGYSSPSYGPNTVAETPNNFLNVFSQAAANTVNFGTQLLNSLVGVAANILQGTVSTLLSLLNAKGQVVGAVVQSAPPVLASVTRTAGDVLAAKARIFGAVTQGMDRLLVDVLNQTMITAAMVREQSMRTKGRVRNAARRASRISVGATNMAIQSIQEAAVQFGSQLARIFGDTYGQIMAARGASSSSSSSSSSSGNGHPLAQLAQIFSGLGSRSNSGGYGSSSSGGSSGGNLLAGAGNFAQTLISSKLNLLNGILSPFTGGRPLLNFGNRGSGSGSSSFSSSSSSSEPNFRISIASASTPNSISLSSPSDSSSTSKTSSSSSGPRFPRFYLNPEVVPKRTDELTPSNLISTFKSGVFKGIVDQFNTDLQSRITRLTSPVAPSDSIQGSYDNSGSYAAAILPKGDSGEVSNKSSQQQQSSSEKGSGENNFSKILLANHNY